MNERLRTRAGKYVPFAGLCKRENPLLKEVPSHLFTFEEKIWGMTLPQLLSDIGAGVGIFTLTSSLPLPARIVVGAFLAILVLLLVHKKYRTSRCCTGSTCTCAF